MVKKKAFAVILGKDYTSYEHALDTLEQERLDERREMLTLKFAENCSKSPQHSHMFPLNENLRANNRNPKKYKEFQGRTSHYYKNPIPYMARLLNKKK